MDQALIDLLRITKLDDNLLGTTNSPGGGGGGAPGLVRNPPEYTHMTVFGDRRRWTIDSAKWTEFWQGYCALAYKGRGNYCLAEKPMDVMPIIADFVLKFQYSPKNEKDGTVKRENPEDIELFGEDFILGVVYSYQQAIQEILQIREAEMDIVCVVMVLEKNWVTDDMLMTQIRIQFPYCKTDVSLQTRLIRPRAIQFLRAGNYISKLRMMPMTDWDNIIDSFTLQEPLLMYKSTMLPNRPKLFVNHLYGRVTPEHLEVGTGPMMELTQVFNPEKHQHVHNHLVTASIFAGDFDLEYWLPMFLSLHFHAGVTIPKNNPQAPVATTTNNTNGKTVSPKLPTPPGTPVTDETFLEMASRFLPMLSRERVETDHFWVDIGKALYNCDGGGDAGLTEWIRFTEKSDNHNEEECRHLYPTFRDNLLSVQTIAYYAREDSPESYADWHKQWCMPSMDKAISCLHADVAHCLWRMYWLEYKCSSMEHNRFWHFKNHRWMKLDHGITLRREISEGFLGQFERWRTDICRQVNESDDPNLKTTMENKLKKIGTLLAKLKTVSFKNNVMKESAEHFYDGRFERLIDANPDLLGMLNCVIEITADGNAQHRPGKPEDYVTMCTGLTYTADLNWQNPVVEKLRRWMQMVFVDHDLREYFLKLSASCLKGRNSDKIFPIWTGEGNNSKSMVVKLFESTFGSYCIKFPTTTLTGNRTQSSSATPEIARSKGTRVAFAQEPDDNEVMKGGIIKEHTGGDRMYGRQLFKEGEEYEIMYKFFFMCNKIPAIPTGGQAVKNRTLIVPFLSTWVKPGLAPATEEEQFKERKFPMDPFFERGIPEMAKAFMWMLVQYYPKYVNDGLVTPAVVSAATDQYWAENDIYQHFTSEMLVRPVNDKGEPDLNASVIHTDLYREFKSWFKEAYPGTKIPDSNATKKEFIRVLGPQQARKWNGLRIVIRDNGANLYPL